MPKMLVLLLLLSSVHSFAYDANQTVLGQDVDGSDLDSKEASDSPHLSDMAKDVLADESLKAPSPFLNVDEKDSGINKKNSKKNKFSHDQRMLGEFDNSKQYIQVDKKELRKSYLGSGTNGFSFTYYRDLKSFDDPNYEQTYEGSKSTDGGTLMFRFDQYLYRSHLELGTSFGAGFGFKDGKGIFASGEESNTTFKLWTLPLDAHILVGMPLGSWSKVMVSGGLSGLGIVENRDDFEDDDKGKEKVQFGYGYSARALFQISLSRMLSGLSHTLFSEYTISNLYLNLEGRMSEIDNFQDETLSYSGSAYGVGFTFEY